MASSSFLSNVPKLKGRENYDDWAFAAENMLVLEDADKYLMQEGDAVKSSTADARARAKLILTIDSSLFVHIKETKTTKELWTKLKSLFDDSGFSRRITLLRHLISIRLENYDNMTNYVTQMVETSQRLSGTGFVINDEWVGSLLLAGLPEKFMPMIMAIEHSGIHITADSIKTKLLDMENVNVFEMTDGNSALIARSWQQKKFGKVGSTNKNGGPNHSTQNQNASTSNSNVKTTKTITCYKCKQNGHYRNQCPLLNEKTEKKKQTNAFSVVFLSGKYNKCDWYVDSGASAHMTTNESWLTNRSNSTSLPEIMVANDTKVSVLCSGDVEITTSHDYEVTVNNVLCVPSLTTNLLSVSQLIKNGNSVFFEPGRCLIRNKLGDLVAEAILIDGVYKLMLQSETCLLTSTVDGQTWHRRLGHLNSTDMNKMKLGLVDGIYYPDTFVTSKSSCQVCCEGKQTRLPFPTGTRATEILQIVHSDICGPMECKSVGGARYFLLFIDDYTRMTFIYFLKAKSETLTYFKEFKSMVENYQNKRIKILRTDNGCEYCSKDFEDFLKREGVIHQKTNPYTPEQNGLSERSNRTIVERARCMLFEAELEKKFWAEAANTAVYLKNRSAASGIEKTPYEMWFSQKPDLKHIRVFGSPVMVHIPKEKRTKWDRKSKKHILVGFCDNVKGYRIYDPIRNQVFTSRDVVIQEKPMRPDTVTVPIESTDSVGELAEESVVNLEPLNKSSSSESDYLDVEVDTVRTEACEENHNAVQANTTPESTDIASDLHGGSDIPAPVEEVQKRARKKPDRYGYANMCATADDGLTYAEAISGPERQQWLQAMAEELQSFDDNQVWEVVDTPSSASVVQCKWVLRKKFDYDNKVRYRARLVAKGFTQKAGIDYQETFSPVIRHSTLRLLFALAVQLDMDITHLDVTTAFLNGYLKENIFMHLPEGFPVCQPNKVLKLKKAVYGLKQSSLAWYERVEEVLCNSGFSKCKMEPCVFVKDHSNNKKTIVGVYVDDFLIFSNCKHESDSLIDRLSQNFKIKNLGQVKRYLGMRVNIDKNKNVITVDQEQYIEQLLEKFDMVDCNSVETPIECKLSVEKSSTCEEKLPYQKLIGSLMYLAVLTRPDIAYSVSFLSQFNNCYSYIHWNYAKRILKYLSHTKTFCLRYSKENAELEGFVDADWASDVTDRRSYTGFCFLKSGAAISWESKKQRTVALSSCEAEYMALSEACREAIYLQRLELEILGCCTKIVIYNDSQSALKLANNCQSHKRSKHIDVRYHFIREVIRSEIVLTKYLPTTKMPADLLTKGLPAVKHYRFMDCLGITDRVC